MKKLSRALLSLALALGFAAALHANDLADKQEAQRQINWGYRMMRKAAAKEAPKVYAKAIKFFEKALKLDPSNETAREGRNNAQAYLDGKGTPNVGSLNNRMKASLKVVNAYKSIRKGDYTRAEAYLKQAAKIDPSYKGVASTRRDLAAAKASGVREGGLDDKEDEEADDADEKEDKGKN